MADAGGAAGAADDIDVFAGVEGGAFGSGKAPFAFEIMEARADIDVTAALSTLTARSAAAGGGTARTGDLSGATAGIAREPTGAAYKASAARTVAKGEALFIRRSDRSVTGRFSIIARRIAG